MSLASGSIIGPYELIREIGRGGMGVVYLARDTRLDRDVAIKALPEHLAQDADRLARFEREAKVLAQLSHPSIAGIYALEKHDGKKFLVMEYVEGDTLAERLDRGAMPVEEAIEIATQIAAGVEAAHEAGVIHRDLKPGNVIVTADGKAKVLDFGLARTEETSSSSSASRSSDSPTLTSPAVQASPTMPGVILGTAAYMSPEQARGRSIDKRSDIWSFGVVLYEMLTGASPFVGETVSDSIGAILHKNIELERLPRELPIGVRRLVKRCLVRDRNQRLQAIGDARVELEDATRQLETGEFEKATSGPRGGWARWAWPTLSGALLVALVAAIMTTREHRGANVAPLRVSQVRQLTDLKGQEQDPALSPDGRTLVYAAHDGADLDIFSLRVGGEKPINLTSDCAADDYDPAFSPDGQYIAFASTREGGGIFVMGATGENPRRVSDAGYDPAWSPDGRTLVYTTEFVENAYSRSTVAQLWTVDVKSRERRQLDTGRTAAAGGWDTDAVDPDWSPDGNWIAFWAVIDGRRDIFVAPSSGGQRIALTDDTPTDWNPMWSADGRHLLFLSDRGGLANLWSITVDPATGRPVGKPVPVTPGPVSMNQATISADGARVAVTVETERSEVVRIGFDPKTERLVGDPRVVYTSSNALIQPEASQDGEWIAYRSEAPSEDIYVMRGDGTGRRRLMNDSYKDRGPRWSADAKTITFYSNRDGRYKVWQMSRNGTDMHPIAALANGTLSSPCWSPDERVLAANSPTPGGQQSVFFDRAEDGTVTQRDMVVPGFFAGSWSPGGNLIAGTVDTADGGTALAVLDVKTGKSRSFTAPDGGAIGTGDNSSEGWLDDERFIGWDSNRDRGYVADVRTGKIRWLADPIDGPAQIQPVRHGTEMIVFRVHRNTDVWAVELSAK